MRRHKLLADMLMAIHVVGFVVLIFGTFYAIGHHWYLKWHLLLIGVVISLDKGIFKKCLLTAWEEKLRQKYDPLFQVSDSFVATYLGKITGKNITRHTAEIILTGVHSMTILIPLIFS